MTVDAASVGVDADRLQSHCIMLLDRELGRSCDADQRWCPPRRCHMCPAHLETRELQFVLVLQDIGEPVERALCITTSTIRRRDGYVKE